MSNSERVARAERRNQSREEATEDSSSFYHLFVQHLSYQHHPVNIELTCFYHLFFSTSTHCIALVVQETDDHLEDGAHSSREEVFVIFDHL